jgi:predicted DNA-binding protein
MAPKRHKKLKRWNQRIAARISDELYNALQDRAYREHKTLSTVVVEAIIKYLGIEMPERSRKRH